MINCCELIMIATFSFGAATCDDEWTLDNGEKTSWRYGIEVLGNGTCTDPNPNLEPNIQSPGDQSGTVGDSVTLQIVATDPESDPLFWDYPALPSGLSGDQAGVISGTLTTEQVVTAVVQVDDNTNSPVSTSFSWTVAGIPVDPQCDNGLDDDGDSFTDLDDPGCDGPTDDDETDPVVIGSLSFEEVLVEDAPGDTEPFGTACADWDKDGSIECMISEHEGGTHTRWEWNGVSFAYKDALTIPRCDLDIYAVDANLDGETDLFCAYINWPIASYVPFENGDLNGAQISSVCGNNRLDNCAPLLTDGTLITRGGDQYAFNGTRASLVSTGFKNGTNSYTQVGGWFIDGFAVDLRPWLLSEETASVKHTLNADFNGDGFDDILLSPHSQVTGLTLPPVVLLNDGSNNFGVVPSAKAFGKKLVKRLGQWNGGYDISKLPDNTSSYWHNYGNIQASDIDKNGTVDLMVFGGTYGDMHQLWLGNGDGTFTRSTALPVIPQGPGTGPGGGQDKPAGSIVDFDEDGCDDLFVTYPSAPSGEAYAKAFRQNSEGCAQ